MIRLNIQTCRFADEQYDETPGLHVRFTIVNQISIREKNRSLNVKWTLITGKNIFRIIIRLSESVDHNYARDGNKYLKDFKAVIFFHLANYQVPDGMKKKYSRSYEIEL